MITVPAYFDDAQRSGATKDAAKLAGLNVLRLLNGATLRPSRMDSTNKPKALSRSTTSAAETLTYQSCAWSRGVFEVLATAGYPSGGDDFARRWRSTFRYPGVYTRALSPTGQANLHAAARVAAKEL